MRLSRPGTPELSFVLKAWVFGLAIISLGFCSPARADILFVGMFRNNESLQTANGNSLSNIGSFFFSGLNSSNPNDFTAVQMGYPGPGSPQALSPTSSTTFGFQTPFLADQAAMDAAYPFGTYSFAATGTPPGLASFDYLSDTYPLSQPYLAGNTYSNLQGMNAAADFAFQFSPFTTGNVASESFIFFTIFDDTANAFVFSQNFLAPTTTGLVLPGGTLQPGHNFRYQLIFDNRVFVPSPGAEDDAQIGFDLRADGNFSTAAAVPEPASMLLFAIGALAAGWPVLRQRRARQSA
jgi:hypothetical protein